MVSYIIMFLVSPPPHTVWNYQPPPSKIILSSSRWVPWSCLHQGGYHGPVFIKVGTMVLSSSRWYHGPVFIKVGTMVLSLHQGGYHGPVFIKVGTMVLSSSR